MNTNGVAHPKSNIARNLSLFAALVVAMVAVPLAAPWAESRVALVIGNGAYKADPLSNPINDAEEIAGILRSLGFDVVKESDVHEKKMRRLIEDFGKRLKRPQAVGLFYYSGHGMQVDGRNYMIPVDADIRREVDVRSDGVPANEVLWEMEQSGSGPNFIILDACRNNPFEKSFKSGKKGLARMDAPAGTLIAYAASPGAVADQGPPGGTSPYTQALAEKIVAAGVSALSMFNSVSREVYRRTKGSQSPYLELSMLGEFYFGGAPASSRSTARPRAEPAVGVYPGRTFKDCDVCPEMVVVPAGSFTMGSTERERRDAIALGAKEEWLKDEMPQHRVTIARPFAVGIYEVTRREYEAFVEATGRAAGDGCYAYDGKEWKKDAARNWRSPGFDQGGDHPVVCVSWDDAKVYAEWLSAKTGKDYRLLTEAEWEYVARADTTTARYWGNDNNVDQGCTYANVADQVGVERYGWPREKTNTFQCRDGYAATAPVGKFRSNEFGLKDALGNVWEWVADCYKADAYKTHEDYPAMVGSWHDSCNRVLRGGSWNYIPRNLRSANRNWHVAGHRSYGSGFRVARTL